MQHILIVSQDEEYRKALDSLLREEGFHLASARTADEAVDQLHARRVDLLIADLESWKEQGIAVYKRIREDLGGKDISSIIIIAPAMMPVISFSLAFDDFAVKQDDPREVLLRIRQLLWHQSRLDAGQMIKIEDLLMDLNSYEVSIQGKRVYLTYKEFELLKCLVLNRGKVFTREALLDKVWGYDNYAGTRTVDIHIQRLRSKLGGTYSDMIQTVRNVGYSFTGNKA
jgi:two-component system, OmpR family, alkaline phosphatase synthesis response regulator PhoP